MYDEDHEVNTDEEGLQTSFALVDGTPPGDSFAWNDSTCSSRRHYLLARYSSTMPPTSYGTYSST